MTVTPPRWHQRPAGKWAGALATWVIGVAAGVQQIVQSIVSGPNGYGYFFGCLAIIVGFVLMAYAFGNTPKGTIGQYIVVFIATIPLLMGSAIVGFQFSANRGAKQPPPGLAISITRPAANALVPHTIQVDGVVENLPRDKQIWIVASGRMDGNLQVPYQFWIQPGPCVYANNAFTCPDIHVGIEADQSRYEIIPIIADKSQERAFAECLADPQHQAGCAPVRPDGIQVSSGVFVQRQ